ncbi:glycosyltransferase [Flavobacterium sp. RSP49]|uniref:glycosyltransferase family 2 protein n=1 Tax=Flavobacterium sp. RSP49 TaxID=2497487 RepID=UPI000F82C15E|nr:glycosyltransferase [Flavobacterium sp. RSP49]RTZ00903.1 glycosyltransferase [Flavobacterium sp. RSP49]
MIAFLQVSIVVPVYNAHKYLHKCIDSILDQTFLDFELLLVNDGSLDGSAEICEEYAQKDSRVKVCHIPNSGVSAARNKGIELASGIHIAFVDADDWIENFFLERFYEILRHDEIDLIVCGYCYEYVSNKPRHCYSLSDQKAKTKNQLGQVIPELEYNRMISTVWGKLYRRDIIVNNKLSFDTTISFGEDTIFTWSYLFLVNSIAVTDTIGYHYVQYDEITLTKKLYGCDITKKTRDKSYELRIQIFEKYDLFSNNRFLNAIQGEYIMMSILANLSMYNLAFRKVKKERYENWLELANNSYLQDMYIQSRFIKIVRILLFYKQINVLDLVLKSRNLIIEK